MSEAVVGYAPAGGRLVLGQYQDAQGRWVEPLYTGDDMMICAATELDKTVLGADTEHVMVVWRNIADEERYRVAIGLSFHGFPVVDAHREDELLQQAAQRRCEPSEDEEPYDARTLTVKPAA